MVFSLVYLHHKAPPHLICRFLICVRNACKYYKLLVSQYIANGCKVAHFTFFKTKKEISFSFAFVTFCVRRLLLLRITSRKRPKLIPNYVNSQHANKVTTHFLLTSYWLFVLVVHSDWVHLVDSAAHYCRSWRIGSLYSYNTSLTPVREVHNVWKWTTLRK